MRSVPRSLLANQISRARECSRDRRRERENGRCCGWMNSFIAAGKWHKRSLSPLFIYLFSEGLRELYLHTQWHTDYTRERCVCVYARARLHLYVWMCMHGDISAARERVRAHYVIRSHNAEPTIKWWDKTMGCKEKQQNLFVPLHAVMAPPQIIMGCILLYGNRLTDTTRVQTLIARQAI